MRRELHALEQGQPLGPAAEDLRGDREEQLVDGVRDDEVGEQVRAALAQDDLAVVPAEERCELVGRQAVALACDVDRDVGAELSLAQPGGAAGGGREDDGSSGSSTPRRPSATSPCR